MGLLNSANFPTAAHIICLYGRVVRVCVCKLKIDIEGFQLMVSSHLCGFIFASIFLQIW